VLRHVRPSETKAVAESFISARTRADQLVALAYRQLEAQTDRQFSEHKVVLLDRRLLSQSIPSQHG
jgi:hypothetical protein